MNKLRALILAGLLLPAAAFSQPSNGYFRYPALRGDTVVFTSEGDLWSASVSGGAARRLTTHPAEESRAAISPDGKWVAFSANYEGPLEAYVMPLEGGLPKRVSFENSQALVVGWSARGEVLYSATIAGGPTRTVAVSAVDPATLARRTFPLADANDAVLDESGRWLYFVRFGLAMTGDNARGYRGGALSQLWRYDVSGGGEAERIGPREVNVRRPMWWNGRLVVVSDQGGRDNLWSLAADGGDARQLTRHGEFDVRGAQLDGGRVVYQLGADLRVLALDSGADRVVPLRLVSDFEQRRERWIDEPLRYLEQVSFAPSGDRVAVTARGRVALAAVGPRRRVDIAAPEGSRVGAAVMSPDGKTVYAICDATGEEEVWRFPADGSPGAQALTRDGDSQRQRLYLSPDGRRLAHDDKRGRLWLLDLSTGVNRLIDDGGADGNEGYGAVVWAPDNRHLALVRANTSNRRPRLALLSVDDGRMQWLTSDRYESGSPAFSPDGQWLWFLSDRHFRAMDSSPWGDRAMGPVFARRTRIYALALQPGLRFPFQAEDELMPAAEREEKKAEEKKTEKTADRKGGKPEGKAAVPGIVWEGLAERLYEAPLEAAAYTQLRATKDRLYFLERGGPRAVLKHVAIGRDKPVITEVMDNVAQFELSADGKKLFVRTPPAGERNFGRLFIADSGPALPGDRGKITVALDDWTLRIDPRSEWRQMFHDAWRMHRDHFYDAGLRGVDWEATRRRFEPLLERVADRNELNDVLAQMMSELGALHSQMRDGDFRKADDGARAAGLGALFERADEGWRIAHVYRTEAELPSERGPLQAPGVDARVGDVITAINGQPTAGVRDISDLLRNRAGTQVLLELKRGASTRRVVVTPVNAQREERLRYMDWVERSRETVQAQGGGEIGYMHLYAMGADDLATFVREFYAQYDRGALIVDVRRNRGGNIDSWIIEKLLRRSWAFWQKPRGIPYANMQKSFRGHLVVLTDAMTYSDGETFAAGVKALGLGPLIGTRTAGAGVWLTDSNRLVDLGRARVAEIPQYAMDGQWLIEGVGVEPDIFVDNLPHATFNGQDAQLAAAIGWLKQKLAAEPVAPLQPRPIPPLN